MLQPPVQHHDAPVTTHWTPVLFRRYDGNADITIIFTFCASGEQAYISGRHILSHRNNACNAHMLLLFYELMGDVDDEGHERTHPQQPFFWCGLELKFERYYTLNVDAGQEWPSDEELAQRNPNYNCPPIHLDARL